MFTGAAFGVRAAVTFGDFRRFRVIDAAILTDPVGIDRCHAAASKNAIHDRGS